MSGTADTSMIQWQHPLALPKILLSCSYWREFRHIPVLLSRNMYEFPDTCLLQRLVHKFLSCHDFIYLCLWCTYAPPNWLNQKLSLKLWQYQHAIRSAEMMPWSPYQHWLSSFSGTKDCLFPSFQPHISYWHALSEQVMSPLTKSALQNSRIKTKKARTASKLRQEKGAQESSLLRHKVV